MATQRTPASCWLTDGNASTHPKHDGVEEEEELEEDIGEPVAVADLVVVGHGVDLLTSRSRYSSALPHWRRHHTCELARGWKR